MSVKDIPNFEQLSDLELIALAEEILASLRHPETLPAPLAHQAELQRRWAKYEQNPNAVLSQVQFREKVKALKK